MTEDEPDDVEDPTEISYVFSGYSPLSVRLVQCVVQKNGVLGKAGAGNDKGDGAQKGKGTDASKLRAHPIFGWKGFEDVVESLPGETIDIPLAPRPAGMPRTIPGQCKT